MLKYLVIIFSPALFEGTCSNECAVNNLRWHLTFRINVELEVKRSLLS